MTRKHACLTPWGQAFVVAFAALVLSAYSFTGYYASDDTTYLATAKRLFAAGNTVIDLGSARLAIVLPAALVSWLSEGLNFAILFSFVLYHPLCVLGTFALARGVLPVGPALVASAFVAFSPLMYLFAGSMLPDLALTFWITVIFVPLIALIRHRESGAPAPYRRFLSLCALAGVFTGLAYSVKETGLISVVPAALFIALASDRFVSRLTVAAGAIYGMMIGVAMALEAVVLYSVTGQWIWRLAIMTNSAWKPHLVELTQRHGIYPHDRAASMWHMLYPNLGPFLVAFLAAIVAFPFLWRRRTAAAVAFAGGWYFVYLTWGSVSLSEYLPGPLVNRYYAVCIPFLAVALAGTVSSIWSASSARIPHLRNPRVAYLAAGALLASFVVETLDRNQGSIGTIYRSRQARSLLRAYDFALAQYPALPVVFSPYSTFRFQSMFRPDTREIRFSTYLDPGAEAALGPAAGLEDFLYIRHPRGQMETSTIATDGRDLGAHYRVFVSSLIDSAQVEAIESEQFHKELLYVAPAPSSRFREVTAALSPLLNLIPHGLDETDARNSIVVERWTLMESRRVGDARVLFDEAKVRAKVFLASKDESGSFMNRAVRLTGPSQHLSLQTFRGQGRSKPQHPAALLSARTRGVRASLRVHVQGGPTRISGSLRLFETGGVMTEISLKPRVYDVGTHSIEVPGACDAECESFRLMLSMKGPGEPRSAAVTLGPLTLVEEDEARFSAH